MLANCVYLSYVYINVLYDLLKLKLKLNTKIKNYSIQ